MKKIIDSIKPLLNKLMTSANKYIPKFAGNNSIILIVACYFIGVCILVSTYFGCWVFNFMNDKTDLGELMTLIVQVTGTNSIAFVSFIAGCFVDLNGNGVPDSFEEKKNDQIE